ncbi:hypothetical protein HD554DRAFT_2062492 [Boletus coccyginus]|nr:hypothetical protein HD554DRAFT_2062492 [Boletus coccyginus]
MSESTKPGSGPSHADVDRNPHSSQLSELLFVSSTILQQAVDLVDNILTDNNQLTVQSKYLPGSTIGKHLRHARDHFILLIDCVIGNQPYVLSYDVRSRNTPMETSLSEAHNALISAISRLKELEVSPSITLDQVITLNAVTPFSHTFETTFGRELWFAALHAVHHWSMVRVIAGELGIFLPDDFGFAPSTLVYRGSDAPLGKAKI